MPSELLAWIFLAAVAVVPCLAIHRSLRRPNFSVPQAFLLTAAVWLTRVLWRAGKPPPIPVEGSGAVIVCNHRSSVDPFFVQVCCDRPIRWMVAREYCEHPLFRWFLSTCNAIPVNRGGIDTAATKVAIRCLREGGLVGMFPEGRINMTPCFMLPVRPGAALVAIKADVPLLPCYIEGSPYDRTPWSPFLMPARTRVRFGAVVHPADLPAAGPQEERVSQLMLAVIQRLAILAGEPGFVPQLAGRRWKPIWGREGN